MLEFAKIPGLTKIFNRDDWMKVFLACSTLPDYRESKYSSYFITTDATIRSGKLYYEKNALDKGGYSYDPISHIVLVNETDATLPESMDYSFGSGDKYEFYEFNLAAKYVSGKRAVTEDVTFNDTNVYYYRKTTGGYKQMVGGSVIIRGNDQRSGNPIVYYNRSNWQKWVNKDGTTTLTGTFTAGWHDAGMGDKDVYYRKADGTFVKYGKISTSSTSESTEYTNFVKDHGLIYILSEDVEEVKHFYQVEDIVDDIGFTVYDSQVIGDQVFSTSDSVQYFCRTITGIDATTDEFFEEDKTYFSYKDGTFKRLVEGTDYDVGDRVDSITGATVGDEYCNRTYTFTTVMADPDVVRGNAITTAILRKYNNYLYKAKVTQSKGMSSIVSDDSTTLYTITAAYGTLNRVTYMQNGYKIANSAFGNPTDLKFRKSGVYYIKSPGTLYVEPGYQVLDSSEYTPGRIISEWEEEKGVKVYTLNTNFYVSDTSLVGSITHGQEWYERAGTNYPYEGFVAVTTAASSNAAIGSLFQCKRKTYELTEDPVHGYTGDGANAVSKSYYEYDKTTGLYTKVPAAGKPVYRNTEGSSFIQTTSDVYFLQNKSYYSDISGSDSSKLNGGTKEDYDADAPLHLNVQYYYSTSGKESDGMRVDAYDGSVYDRERPIYYREYDARGNGTWVFHQIGDRYGLTTDTKWDDDKEYRFYSGRAYNFTTINKNQLFSVVDDTLFGYEDFNDLYYGFSKLIAGTDYIIGTTTPNSLVKEGVWKSGAVYTEDIAAHVITELPSAEKDLPMTGDKVYHIRNIDHVAEEMVGTVHASKYCEYDSSERKVTNDKKNIPVDDGKIGTYIGTTVYGEYADAAMSTYYYMSDPTHASWVGKFAEFQINFTSTESTDTTPVAGKKYYVKTDNYVKSSDTTWRPYKSYYTLDSSTTPPTYSLYGLQKCTGATWQTSVPYWDIVDGKYIKVDNYVTTKDTDWLKSTNSAFESVSESVPDTTKEYYTSDSTKGRIKLSDYDVDDYWYRMWVAAATTADSICFKAGVQYYSYDWETDPVTVTTLSVITDPSVPSSATGYHVGESMRQWILKNCPDHKDSVYICTPYLNGERDSATVSFVENFEVDLDTAGDGTATTYRGYYDYCKREKPYYKKDGALYTKVNWSDYSQSESPAYYGLYQDARVTSIRIGDNYYNFGGMTPAALDLYSPDYSSETSGPASKTNIYELGESTYTECTSVTDPKAQGLYEFTDSYYGRLINSQSKTIYRSGDKGSIPTECPICVTYKSEEATASSGSIYRDGEEIPTEPSLFVESLNGESILPDEYYEECYGLYYWDQFFLDHGISCTPITGVTAFMTGDDTNKGTLYLTWTDPTIMIKEGEATATPDAWEKTSVELYDPDSTTGGRWTLLVSTSCNAYKEVPLQLDLSNLKTVAYAMDKGVVTRPITVSNVYQHLRNGYIIITAISTSETKAVYNVKVSDMCWTKKTGPKLINMANGSFIDSDMSSMQTLSGVAIPGVKYVNAETGADATDVFERITSINLGTNYNIVYSKDTPMMSVTFTDNTHTEVSSYTPIIVGETVIDGRTVQEGDLVVFPSSSTNVIYCAVATPYAEMTVQEIIQRGFGPTIFDIGTEIYLPNPIKVPPTKQNESSSSDQATVIDFDNVRLQRNIEMNYVHPDGHTVTEVNETYYIRTGVINLQTTETGGKHYQYAEVSVPAGVSIGNKFFVHGDKPHLQYYTKKNKASSILGDANFETVDYNVPGWEDKVFDPGVPIYFHNPSIARGGYYEFEEDTHSVSFKVTAPVGGYMKRNSGDNYVAPYDYKGTSGVNSKAYWTDSKLREFLNCDEYERITSVSATVEVGRTYYAYSSSTGMYYAFSTPATVPGPSDYFNGTGTKTDPYTFKDDLVFTKDGVTYRDYYKFNGYLGGSAALDKFYKAIRPVRNQVICRRVVTVDKYMLTEDVAFKGEPKYFIDKGEGTAGDPYRLEQLIKGTDYNIGDMISINTVFNEPVLTTDTEYNESREYVRLEGSIYRYLEAGVDYTIGTTISDASTVYWFPDYTADMTYKGAPVYFSRTGEGTEADPYVYHTLVEGTDYIVGEAIPPNSIYQTKIVPAEDYHLTADTIFQSGKSYYSRSGEGTSGDPYKYTKLIAGTNYEVGDSITPNSVYEATFDFVYNETVVDKIWIPSLNQIGISSVSSPDTSVWTGSVAVQAENAVLAGFSYNAYRRARANYPKDTYGGVVEGNQPTLGYNWWRINPRIMPRTGTPVMYYTRSSIDFDANKKSRIPLTSGGYVEIPFNMYGGVITDNGGNTAAVVTDISPKIFAYFTIA